MPAPCPCIDAHRRLMDVHEDIHRAIESYLDANEFRRNLNSALQNARGVTWLLQKRKSTWVDFDEWYGGWQAEARQNPILGWSVLARNRIVKEEDLRTLSQARVSFYGDRLREAEHILQVKSDMTVEQMLAMYAGMTSEIPPGKPAWIRVQRRWVDDQLPDHELVSALREVYRGVAKAVMLAHVASDATECAAPRFARACVVPTIDGLLPCLGHDDPLPSGLLDARTGDRLRTEYGSMEADPTIAERGLKRYGRPPRFSNDPIEHARQRLALSRQFLEADGYAGPSLMLLRGRESRLAMVPFHDDEPRELVIALAVDAVGAWPFSGAVFSSELWIQSVDGGGPLVDTDGEEMLPSNEEFFDADPIGGRTEALTVVGLASDGRCISMVLPFARTAKNIVYGSLIEEYTRDSVPAFLRPIWLRWPANDWPRVHDVTQFSSQEHED